MDCIIENAALEVRAKEEKSIKRQESGTKTSKLQRMYSIEILNTQLQEGQYPHLIKVYVKSRGTDCKNSNNFSVLHRIWFLSIRIDSCT